MMEPTRTLRFASPTAWPARVRVVGEDGAVLAIGAAPVVIGAGSVCDLVVNDTAVSRRHLEIEATPRGIHVRDLGSRNGTYYLDQRIESAVVATGTFLRVGQTTLAIEVDPQAVPESELPRPAGFRGMIGSSPAMQRLFGAIARLDASLAPVLIRGETGAGKELVARALHEGSKVASGPFVPINCGALPRELVASTLFGHKRGAFTGATDARRGAFGAADGGTLFLDEIGELPIDLQPALLRALEHGEVLPVGEDVPRRVRVRIVAATHRDLAADVGAARFREDLYYRLACIALEVPALRDRPEDIAPLAELFARQEGFPGAPASFLAELVKQRFPGNVRELRGAVVAHMTLGVLGATPASGVARRPDVAVEPSLEVPFLEQRDALVEAFTNKYLEKLLAATNGNQTLAAKMAGLDRTYLGRLLQRRPLGSQR